MEDLRSYIPGLVESLQIVDPVKIILFGSLADGEQQEDSDIDLVVILNTDVLPQTADEKLLYKVKVRNAIRDISFEIPIDLIVYTKAELSRLESIKSPFLNEISEKGKILYEKAS